MQVIFSCEDKTYMWWQAELLHHSFHYVGMDAELTALVVPTSEAPNDFTCNTVRVSSYAEKCSLDPLLCLNKPGGMAEWAALPGDPNETVLIVDPDTVFYRRIRDIGPLADGRAYSEEHDYMSVEHPDNKLIINRHCKPEYRANIQPVGIYIMINRRTLLELARLWLQKSIEIASHPVCRNASGTIGWLSDMWGYVLAAAELGIRHEIRGFSQVTGINSLQYPLIHYCYPLMAEPTLRWRPDTDQPLLWSKWHYQPWTNPPSPETSTKEGCIVLERLGEMVRAKRKVGEESPLQLVGASA